MKLKVMVHPNHPEDFVNAIGWRTLKKGEIIEADINNAVVRHYLQNRFLVVVED